MDTPQNQLLQADKLLQDGSDQLQKRDFSAALASFAEHMQNGQSNPSALHGYALALFGLGRNTEAVEFFEKALELTPHSPVYLNNYGMALMACARLYEAKSAFILATRIKANYAEAWTNLGLVMGKLHEPAEKVEQILLQALHYKPENMPAHEALDALYFASKRFKDALRINLQMAKRIPEKLPQLYYRAAQASFKLSDYHTALGLLKEATTKKPTDASLQELYARALGECGFIAEAKTTFNLAVDVHQPKENTPQNELEQDTTKAPQNAYSKGTLSEADATLLRWAHLAYCPEYFADSNAIEHYWATLQHDLNSALAENMLFDWRTLPTKAFSASFHITHLKKNHKTVLELYAKLFEKSFNFPKPALQSFKQQRIKLGFFVAPGHTGGFARTTGQIIRHLDPVKFECLLFYPKNATALFAKLQGAHITHAPYAGNFEHIVKLISSRKCDLLYHWKAAVTPLTFFLPMCNTAPVQCTSWGTHGTSGLSHIDYYLSWAELEANDAQNQYTEKLALINTPPVLETALNLPPLAGRKKLGLPEKGTLFFCPHRLSKYHPDFDFYMRDILEGDRTANILLLFDSAMPAEELVRLRMIKNTGAHARRLLFLPRLSPERYIQFIGACDIVLDSPAYSTSLSGFDSLYLGKPIITQEGTRQLERFAAANYRAMRIYDAPITHSQAEYVHAALELSKNTDARTELSERIKKNASVFTDISSIVGAVSNFFEQAAGRG